jgi:hypothetical protein
MINDNPRHAREEIIATEEKHYRTINDNLYNFS